ncbi:MAG: Uma2 family endonuclease [Isosphaeraceae bacterium]
MATVTTEPPTRAKATPLDHPYEISVNLYQRMIDLGVFRASDPVYLWKGRLVAKMTKGRQHVVTLTKLYDRVVKVIPDGWHVEQEQPIEIGRTSMPEPDLMVVRGSPDDYLNRAPGPGDVALIVEVADSSLAEDQGDVLVTYAEKMIPIYLIVNLPQRRMEVHTDPTGPAEAAFYRTVRFYGLAEELPLILDGLEIARFAVRDLLP